MQNKVQLITYVDRFGGNTIADLKQLLSGPLAGLFGAVHLLPFFYPIDGEDAGFDPIDHTMVDPKLGDWDSIRSLSAELDIMADMIVNHISSDSSKFKDVLEHGENSEFWDLFLNYSAVFPNAATEKELLEIYRPRPGFPFTKKRLKDQSHRLFWTTFTSKQIDIDVQHPLGKAYLLNILKSFQNAGIKMIRLDAVGYAIKTPGTTCFMTGDTFKFIESLRATAIQQGIEVLVEIHSYYQQQIEIAKKVDWVYDFALPPLILHTLFKQNSKGLKHWLSVSPRNAITVLDTHDGIGIIDIGPGSQMGQEKGLVSPSDIDDLVEKIHEKSAGTSRKATGAAASNLDLYQVNCTFYEALGKNDRHYLLARLIQFFAPGVPQVYYVGFLAGLNDMELLDKTGVGRNINRAYFTSEEVHEGLQKPVVQALCKLIRFRNEHPAFDGEFFLKDSTDNQLNIRWTQESTFVELMVELDSYEFYIEYSFAGRVHKVENHFDFEQIPIKAI